MLKEDDSDGDKANDDRSMQCVPDPYPPHCIRSNKAGGVAGGGCELRGNAEVTQKFLRNSCKNSSATYAEPGEIDQLNWNERERPLRKNVGTFCIV